MSFSVKHFFSKRKARVLLGLFSCLFLFVPTTFAEATRSYSYDGINFKIQINKDTTVNVVEYEGFNFIGEYHQGWRNIPKKGIDDLTNVSVIDGTTGKPLTYSAQRLVKTDPSSWGKYTTFFDKGEYIIEWYFDAKDTRRTYELRYTLHGAIGFYTDHDELYWNLFTAYTVPILRASAIVTLPQPVDRDNLRASFYVHPLPLDKEKAKWQIYPLDASGKNLAYGFEYENIPVGADMTIAPGWPKGVVDQHAYWKYWFGKNWGYIGAGIMVLVTIITILLRWYFTERYHAGRGVGIPEYAPPQDLPPAMADVLVHERLSPKAWAATIVDLAFRGYVKIEEKPQKKLWTAVSLVLYIATLLYIATVIPFPSQSGSLQLFRFAFWMAIGLSLLSRPIYLLWLLFLGKTLPKSLFSQTDYIITRVPNPKISGKPLEEYEKKFLHILFGPGSGGVFSTFALRKDPVRSRIVSQDLKNLKKDLQGEILSDTNAYEVGFRAWEVSKITLFILSILCLLVLLHLIAASDQILVFFLVVSYCLLALFLFFVFNPRLNKQGQILREEWLGFKLYLETAERYRMQNLTPETFEKYLPYAIIFGVEEKWGKAFEGIAMPQPTWYSGSSMGDGSSFASSGGFSASAFSSSFSASFSSAFASSGGSGGGSGGGGGAGGGGGGGGGGAS